MFNECTQLSSIYVHFSDWKSSLTVPPTKLWVNGIASHGTFKCPADLEQLSGINNIPEYWDVQTFSIE